MKIDAYSLVIDITEKCNMKCRHCLRGSAKNNNITQQMMNEIVSKFDTIDTITFGGGEPTLHLDSIRWFIDATMMHNVDVGNFYIVTNAKAYHRELEDICDLLYNICFDNEISGLTVSDDMFHQEFQTTRSSFERNRDRYLYGEEIYAQEIKNYDIEELYLKPYARPNDKVTKYTYGGIINMGRAKTNGLGDRELVPYFPTIEQDYDGTICIGDTLFIRYNGDIFCDCDLSYEEMDKRDKSIFYLGSIFNMQAVIDKLWENQRETKVND